MNRDEKAARSEEACGIHAACDRQVPTWLILLDNVPTLILFVLGASIVGRWWTPLWPFFLAYCALAIVLFWRLICTCCPHYATGACPCGYGRIAPKFFKSRPNGEFRKVFKRNIAVMFPCWLVPTALGIDLLLRRYSDALFGLFIAFGVVGFLVIPLISKFVGCRGCQIKDRCPWMS